MKKINDIDILPPPRQKWIYTDEQFTPLHNCLSEQQQKAYSFFVSLRLASHLSGTKVSQLG